MIHYINVFNFCIAYFPRIDENYNKYTERMKSLGKNLTYV